MEYGYTRISTSKQNIERQVRNIQSNYPSAIIVREFILAQSSKEEKRWINC